MDTKVYKKLNFCHFVKKTDFKIVGPIFSADFAADDEPGTDWPRKKFRCCRPTCTRRRRTACSGSESGEVRPEFRRAPGSAFGRNRHQGKAPCPEVNVSKLFFVRH